MNIRQEIIQVLQQEIDWCNSEEGQSTNIDYQYRNGYLKGLKQAQYLINELFKQPEIKERTDE
jgi:hypothetical protein